VRQMRPISCRFNGDFDGSVARLVANRTPPSRPATRGCQERAARGEAYGLLVVLLLGSATIAYITTLLGRSFRRAGRA
jgi:hypothetical protein